MKYILAAIILLLSFLNSNAQIKKIPRIVKSKEWTILSRTTAHKGYEDINISAAISKTEGKGETLSFKSNTLVTKVEIGFLKSKLPKSTYINEQGTKSYQFYLESGAYKPGLENGYLLHFYVKGFDKPIWVVLLTKNYNE
jgi:hypothetical protein